MRTLRMVHLSYYVHKFSVCILRQRLSYVYKRKHFTCRTQKPRFVVVSGSITFCAVLVLSYAMHIGLAFMHSRHPSNWLECMEQLIIVYSQVLWMDVSMHAHVRIVSRMETVDEWSRPRPPPSSPPATLPGCEGTKKIPNCHYISRIICFRWLSVH